MAVKLHLESIDSNLHRFFRKKSIWNIHTQRKSSDMYHVWKCWDLRRWFESYGHDDKNEMKRRKREQRTNIWRKQKFSIHCTFAWARKSIDFFVVLSQIRLDVSIPQSKLMWQLFFPFSFSYISHPLTGSLGIWQIGRTGLPSKLFYRSRVRMLARHSWLFFNWCDTHNAINAHQSLVWTKSFHLQVSCAVFVINEKGETANWRRRRRKKWKLNNLQSQ